VLLADRVAVLADARIAATGSHAELLATEPRYAELMGDVPAEAGSRDSQEAVTR
jgi:ABC-type transport system involved in cytochrome bd biosynthesis fused ATPase/permease subunit